MACLCAPTTHEGSFRCRLHRLGTKSTNLYTERAIPKILHHHHRRHDDHHFMAAPRDPPLGDPRPSSSSSSSSARIDIPAPATKKCASLAMIKHFKQKQAGSPRHSHRNPGFPIGPSRLSRMAVACAENLPLLKEDCTTTPCSGSTAGAGTARKVRLREPEEYPGSASIRAMQMKLKTRSTNTFKQSRGQ